MRLHVRTDNASWLAIGCFYMQTYGARRKREGAAARRIRAAAWLNASARRKREGAAARRIRAAAWLNGAERTP